MLEYTSLSLKCRLNHASLDGERLQSEWPAVEKCSCLYCNTYINYGPPYFPPPPRRAARRRRHYCLSGRARWKDRKWKWRKEPTKEHETAVFRRKMGAFFFALLCFAAVGWLAVPRCLSSVSRECSSQSGGLKHSFFPHRIAVHRK